MSEALAAIKQAVAAAGPAEKVMAQDVLDRILKAANFEEPDRVPIWDFVDSWPVYQLFAPGDTDPVTATAKVFHGLGIDLCRSVYLPVSPEEDSPAASDHGHGYTRWAQWSIRSPEELRAYEVPRINEEQAWEWVREYCRQRDIFAPQTLLVPCDGVGFHATYGLMGIEQFSYALYEQFEDIRRIVEAWNDNAVMRAKAFAEARPGPLYFLGDDIAFKGRAMFSPKVMHALFYPYLERICSVLKPAGIKVIFHTDGYVMDIVADLLAAGIDGLNPIEPLAGNDIGELKRRYGERLILVGNIDCSQTLPLGTVDDVRRAVQECLLAAAPGGGHFIGSSSEIVPATPVENIFAFYEACREYGRYPIGEGWRAQR